jgi:uncharacterized protein (TIGR03437 family)
MPNIRSTIFLHEDPEDSASEGEDSMNLRSLSAFALILVCAGLFVASDAQAQNLTYTYSYDGAALPIFRDSANIITVANIFVARAILVSKVTVNVEIDYPRPGDLNLYMYSPLLTRTKLLERNCGNTASVANVTFDDAAPTKYSDVCPSAPGGTYRANEPLSNFNQQVALGIWSIAIENNGSDDIIGYLRGFTITFTGTAVTNKPITGPNAVFNAAGFQAGVVAPGEMINIQGFNMGPSPGVLAPAGNLPTTLGGVQVMFDNTPAALSFASSYVVTAQVPFSIQPGTQTQMRVISQSVAGDPVTLDVLTVVPGVYTQSANGKGPVTAVNPDGTVNALTNPAPKGRYVAIYASGLGTVNPALATGQVPPATPVSSTTSAVSAVIDGVNANVNFAGAAPGFPGLYQINVQIPSTSGSGARSLTLFAGGGSPSQFGTTIYVQ